MKPLQLEGLSKIACRTSSETNQERRFSNEQINEFVAAGVFQSLTSEEIQADWLDRFPKMQGRPDSAPSFSASNTTFSLRLDGGKSKYLYSLSKEHDANTQIWVPSMLNPSL